MSKKPKPLLIYGRPGCGLFSMVFQVIALARRAEQRGQTPVVYLGREVCFWEESGYNGSRNAWEYLFEPVSSLRVEDLGISRDILEAPESAKRTKKIARRAEMSNEYLWDDIGAFGLPGRTTADQLSRLVAAGKRFLRVRPNVVAKANAFAKIHFSGDVIGVHYRGTDKVYEATPVPFQRYVDCISSRPAFAKLFVATDSAPFLQHMRDRFGAARVVAIDALRSSDDAEYKVGVHKTGGARAVEEALVDALLLARCQHMVHGTSNLPGGVIVFNHHITRTDLSDPHAK